MLPSEELRAKALLYNRAAEKVGSLDDQFRLYEEAAILEQRAEALEERPKDSLQSPGHVIKRR